MAGQLLSYSPSETGEVQTAVRFTAPQPALASTQHSAGAVRGIEMLSRSPHLEGLDQFSRGS